MVVKGYCKRLAKRNSPVVKSDSLYAKLCALDRKKPVLVAANVGLFFLSNLGCFWYWNHPSIF